MENRGHDDGALKSETRIDHYEAASGGDRWRLQLFERAI